MPLGEASPGMSVGWEASGELELPASSPGPSPSLGVLLERCPRSAQGPASLSAPQGPCPTRGCMGLSLAPAILDGLNPTSAA